MTVLQPELVEAGAGRNCERLGEPDCSRPHHVGLFWLCDMIVALVAVHPAACSGGNITARLSSCQTPATVKVSETRGLLTLAFQLSITTVIALIICRRASRCSPSQMYAPYFVRCCCSSTELSSTGNADFVSTFSCLMTHKDLVPEFVRVWNLARHEYSPEYSVHPRVLSG